jgi:hypothetical protein
MKKHLKNKFVLALSLVAFVWIFTHAFGPIDTFPRVQQTSISPDGLWKVEIIKRKGSFCPMSETFISIKVTNVQTQITHDTRIFRTTSWNTDKRKYEVRFEPDVIILNEFWVINKDNFDLKMCPLLEECLEENKE